jgi:hypothetical protein
MHAIDFRASRTISIPLLIKMNRLKDSDVTWLYGPLHTAADDWDRPPKPKADPTSVGKDNSAHDRFDLSTGAKKPILKHRSISQLLTSDLPSPMFSPVDSDDDEWLSHHNGFAHEDGLDAGDGKSEDAHGVAGARRPQLLHTKSDTHITRLATKRAYRRESPPRIIATNAPSTNDATPSTATVTGTPASSIQSSNGLPCLPRSGTCPGIELDVVAKKKHISFNTFVEQCIAIEKPKSWRGDSGSRKSPLSRASTAFEDAWTQDDGSVKYFKALNRHTN